MFKKMHLLQFNKIEVKWKVIINIKIHKILYCTP